MSWQIPKIMKQYADAMIDDVFEHNILLKVQKKLNTEEDEQKSISITIYIVFCELRNTLDI